MIQGYKELFDDYDSIEQDKEKLLQDRKYPDYVLSMSNSIILLIKYSKHVLINAVKQFSI